LLPLLSCPVYFITPVVPGKSALKVSPSQSTRPTKWKKRIHCKLNTKLNSAHHNFPKDAY